MAEKLLEIKDLEVVYRSDRETVCAINKVDIALKKGRTLGIVGETGAGKTTLSLSILRLLPERTGVIKSGQIIFEGEDLLGYTEKQMRGVRGEKISMIFQDPMTALNATMTIGSQIAEAISLHNHSGMSKEEIGKRVDKTLEMVGIAPSRKEDYPHQFSGGMKQRVVIAIALACEPQLLIADEPTTALDVTIQAQVLAMMNDLKGRLGTSMIMITHDLGIVASTCDDVAIMYAGEIIESGTVEDIFRGKNHHPYTNGLFGSIPDLNGNSKRLNPIDGLMPDPTDLPKGCNFSPRCPNCMEICKITSPAGRVEAGHRIVCHLFDTDNGEG